MQLSKDLIIKTSLDILHSYGLADMTMRRLARQLGVAPGALYWHFQNKQALIDATAREILKPFLANTTPVSSPASTSHRFITTCTQLRTLMLSYRDGAELIGAALADEHLRQELEQQLMLTLDFCPSALRETVVQTTVHFILGATTVEQLQQQRHDVEISMSSPSPERESHGDESFLAGIRLIINGAISH
ncbi:TetR family transcriptional regulator [Corynebacterium sp. sy017]|uniref:TetR family transcriptional regulator n=1 Tax=unclassified Corynebacterium TaxID=2624378 RepID=UPI00118622D0|nr:TetR family transcriptional regulator [Corynebacterium sp. SY003]MBP3087929.1 TetR family transcriptional regulator [Corynebacterium sp. sy017]TSD92467.1 TetR family transcriptional regulator [Corynebacterium sp. SY003]